MNYVDYFLDRITMYRLMLYYLIVVLLWALVLSFFGLIHYTPLSLLGSTAIVLSISLVTNWLFSWVFSAPTNLESAYITSLILVCILPPWQTVHDLPLLIWAPILAMAAKYILAIRKKHVFNPTAIAVVLTAYWLNLSASWWVGTTLMAPIVLLGGLLIVRKIRRIDLVFSFFVAAIVTIGLFTLAKGSDLLKITETTFLHSSLLFFAFVMLTEPLTTPPTQVLQIIYGGLIGILFAPQLHFGKLYSTPELALVVGNVFSFVVSPKIKERLVLKEKNHLAPDVLELVFQPSHPLKFHSGQYLEFTLPHAHTDARGNRRYFTVASSPTEPQVHLGVKFYPNSSSFKKTLGDLEIGETLMAGQLAGDFTLPKETNQKLVFMAGGIGITPFRSMIKYLIDTKQSRDIVLLYMNKTKESIVYGDLFAQAEPLGVHTHYILTDPAPPDWQGLTGFIDANMIKKTISDYQNHFFYISGPQVMVASMRDMLQGMGVKADHIKKDFFPGLV